MSQVKNLRAMFESKGDSTPPDRGRSPVVVPRESPRPLSKVRTNFIAVEKDGRIGLQRESSTESSQPSTTAPSSIATLASPGIELTEQQALAPAMAFFKPQPILERFRQEEQTPKKEAPSSDEKPDEECKSTPFPKTISVKPFANLQSAEPKTPIRFQAEEEPDTAAAEPTQVKSTKAEAEAEAEAETEAAEAPKPVSPEPKPEAVVAKPSSKVEDDKPKQSDVTKTPGAKSKTGSRPHPIIITKESSTKSHEAPKSARRLTTPAQKTVAKSPTMAAHTPSKKTAAAKEKETSKRAPITPTLTKPPSNAPTKTPSRSASRPPAKTPSRSVSRPPAKTPARSPSRLPAKTSGRSTSRPPAKTPARSPSRPPAKTPARSPSRPPAKTSGRSTSRPPAKTPARSASRPPAKTPSRSTSRPPAKTPAKTPTRSTFGKPPSAHAKHSASPGRNHRSPTRAEGSTSRTLRSGKSSMTDLRGSARASSTTTTTTTTTTRPSTRAGSRASSVAPTLRRQQSFGATKAQNQNQRPSLGLPPKKETVVRPPPKEVDEGFLARMMRPTQSSQSKVTEKVPVTPPRKATTTPRRPLTRTSSSGPGGDRSSAPSSAQRSTRAYSRPPSRVVSPQRSIKPTPISVSSSQPKTEASKTNTIPSTPTVASKTADSAISECDIPKTPEALPSLEGSMMTLTSALDQSHNEEPIEQLSDAGSSALNDGPIELSGEEQAKSAANDGDVFGVVDTVDVNSY